MLTALQGTVRDGAWALQVIKGELGWGTEDRSPARKSANAQGHIAGVAQLCN